MYSAEFVQQTVVLLLEWHSVHLQSIAPQAGVRLVHQAVSRHQQAVPEGMAVLDWNIGTSVAIFCFDNSPYQKLVSVEDRSYKTRGVGVLHSLNLYHLQLHPLNTSQRGFGFWCIRVSRRIDL